jgi:hypothetical protein
VTRNGLLGQVQPAQAGQVEVVVRDGAVHTVDVDEVGWFTVRPAPRLPFRIACTTRDGSIKVVPPWIEL